MPAKTRKRPGKKITRSEAVEKLHALRSGAADIEDGYGRIFKAKWVTVGDEKHPPRVVEKALRFQVSKHLKGGHLNYDPLKQGYMTVYEMKNENRAMKDYQDGARHRLEEIEPLVEAARKTADQCLRELESANKGVDEADKQLNSVQQANYDTKKARTDAERPCKQNKKEAARALKAAHEDGKKACTNLDELLAQQTHERLKLSNPDEALSREILKRIANRQKDLEKATDPQEIAELQARMETEKRHLAKPILSLMTTYCTLNTRGLLELEINGELYVITTPPYPPVPADYKP